MFRILDARFLGPGVKQFELEAPRIARKQKAGQFVIIRLHDQGERIPLTIKGSDPEKGTIFLVVQSIGKTTYLMNSLETGDSINYDPEDAFLGYHNTYGVMATFKPSKRLQLGVDFSKETFWRSAGGERLWDYNVVRQRTTYQVSKTLSFRAIVDYNFFYKEAFGSLLASWVLRPGTVFFIGFDNNYLRDETGHFLQDNYNVFVKFSYWWRL